MLNLSQTDQYYSQVKRIQDDPLLHLLTLIVFACARACVYMLCAIHVIVFASLAVRFNTLIRPRGPVFVWSLNGGLVFAAQAWLDGLNQTIRVPGPEEHLTTSY